MLMVSLETVAWQLSDMTKFRTDDIIKTLQAFNLIRYFGGQHSIYVSPKTLETYYTKAKPNCGKETVSVISRPSSEAAAPVGRT